MTRVAENRVPVPPEAEIGLDLLLGPLGGYTEDQYRAAPNAYPWVHEEGVGKGWRSWAYWRFRLGEEPPDDRKRESIRLAELGELTPEEIAEIAADAERARVPRRGRALLPRLRARRPGEGRASRGRPASTEEQPVTRLTTPKAEIDPAALDRRPDDPDQN